MLELGQTEQTVRWKWLYYRYCCYTQIAACLAWSPINFLLRGKRRLFAKADGNLSGDFVPKWRKPTKIIASSKLIRQPEIAQSHIRGTHPKLLFLYRWLGLQEHWFYSQTLPVLFCIRVDIFHKTWYFLTGSSRYEMIYDPWFLIIYAWFVYTEV